MAKTVLVTGASSGFGRAISTLLVQQGHKVIGTSRKVEPHQTEAGVHMVPLNLDVPSTIDDAVAYIEQNFGPVDVLVNNAGIGVFGAIEETALEDVEQQMKTNFFGHVAVIQKFLPMMRKNGRGRIINIGSIGGTVALPYQAFYSASKAAMGSITEALRLELYGSPIDCTLIAPGDFKTEMTGARIMSDAPDGSPHAQRKMKVLKQYEHDEQNGSDPVLVAQLVDRLINQKTVKPYYTVGRFDQRAAMVLKGLMPASVFEALMRKLYF